MTAIHNKLPPGGILVFVTGQREVDSLVRKLQRTLAPRGERCEDAAVAAAQASVVAAAEAAAAGGEDGGSAEEESGPGLDAFSADNIEAAGDDAFVGDPDDSEMEDDYESESESDLEELGGERLTSVYHPEAADGVPAEPARTDDWGAGPAQNDWCSGARAGGMEGMEGAAPAVGGSEAMEGNGQVKISPVNATFRSMVCSGCTGAERSSRAQPSNPHLALRSALALSARRGRAAEERNRRGGCAGATAVRHAAAGGAAACIRGTTGRHAADRHRHQRGGDEPHHSQC